MPSYNTLTANDNKTLGLLMTDQTLTERLADLQANLHATLTSNATTATDISNMVDSATTYSSTDTQDGRYEDLDTPMSMRSPSVPRPTHGLPFDLWESLAYDMALAHAPTDELCRAYEITPEQLAGLSGNVYFAKLLAAKKQEVEEAGDNASFITRFRVITSLSMREFMRRMTSQATSDRDFHTMFKTALEMGRLMPTTAEQSKVQIDVGGSNGVTLNVFSMPGLDHLASNAPTDVTPQSASNAPTDVTPQSATPLPKPVVIDHTPADNAPQITTAQTTHAQPAHTARSKNSLDDDMEEL